MKFTHIHNYCFEGRDISFIRSDKGDLWFKINQVSDAMNFAPGSLVFMYNFTMVADLKGQVGVLRVQEGKAIRTNHLISEKGVRKIADKNPDNPDAKAFVEWIEKTKNESVILKGVSK